MHQFRLDPNLGYDSIPILSSCLGVNAAMGNAAAGCWGAGPSGYAQHTMHRCGRTALLTLLHSSARNGVDFFARTSPLGEVGVSREEIRAAVLALLSHGAEVLVLSLLSSLHQIGCLVSLQRIDLSFALCTDSALLSPSLFILCR